MLGMASDISKQFSTNLRDVATEPHLPKDMMMRAAEMENTGFQAFKATAKGSGRTYYVLPSETCSEENANNRYYQQIVKKSWTSFDEYISYGYQLFWLVNFCAEKDDAMWMKQSTCSCPVFFKQNLCKHIVAIALQQQIIDCPLTSNPLLIAPRRKPGRSKNATKALMR